VTAAAAVRCEGLVHVFSTPTASVAALRGIDVTVLEGETVGLLGPSGAGKTTFLWHVAGLLQPTAGTVHVRGHALHRMGADELRRFRVGEVGILLQNPGRNLLGYATALENLTFAQRAAGRARGFGARHRARRDAARRGLFLAGLEHRADRPAARLSGGEQQRLALGVALVNEPKLLLADEPTSQLDRESAERVLELLTRVNREQGTTVMAVTHDPEVAASVGRTITIRDGRAGSEGRGGQDLLVVGRDGSVQLPPHVLTDFPPGSLLRAVARPDGVDLRRPLAGERPLPDDRTSGGAGTSAPPAGTP
jgi:putative ABC transport system ATP-binding protein